MNSEDLYIKVFELAQSFGLEKKNDHTANGNAIVRKNISEKAYNVQSAYFGFISPDEEQTGAYSDFSFVIFPQKDEGECVLAIGVGSLGYKNDLSLASLPGLRRSFYRLMEHDGKSFCKTSFLDIESTSKDLLDKVKTDYPNLQGVIERYKTVLPASRIIDPTKDFNVLAAWLAKYAEFRGWATNTAQRKAIQKALDECIPKKKDNEYSEIKQLLNDRRFVVLQGAPGTGKTYTALKIAKEFTKNNVFFEQFHAETTYSDFIYGIRPKLMSETLQYEEKKGVLYKVIEYAKDHSEEKTLLIIDEINRANLSNVLGPVFYLFEYQTENRNCTLEIGDMHLEQLPSNLYIIATMNTADRSLAVVDFALRRRFAWYTLKPHSIVVDNKRHFHKELFQRFNAIFDKYATDEELNLQPGQSYFITNSHDADKEMKSRLVYELMPLMKEYFAEGFMLDSQNEFSELFYQETNLQMYE